MGRVGEYLIKEAYLSYQKNSILKIKTIIPLAIQAKTLYVKKV
jgi:hypothetical protein